MSEAIAHDYVEYTSVQQFWPHVGSHYARSCDYVGFLGLLSPNNESVRAETGLFGKLSLIIAIKHAGRYDISPRYMYRSSICHWAARIGGVHETDGIQNFDDKDHHAYQGHSMRSAVDCPVACKLRELNSGILPLHYCYAHMEASRSIRPFNFGIRPPRHCYTYGEASRLARQPVPQYLSRIYIRRRLIFFCTS
jgi:hypothetical protein